MEKIIKPIVGLVLIGWLTYIGLGILFKGGETVKNRMEERAATPKASKDECERAKKLEIELALLREKLRLEAKKVKEHKTKIKELDSEIRRMRNSSYYPGEEINKSFNNESNSRN